jgi:hypothetical protein
MKIVVTYESEDISRLIRQDLARQGIPAADADIKYSKGNAVVSVEVTPDDVPGPTSIEEVIGVTEHVAARPPPAATPVLAVVDGGAAEPDMSTVFAASNKIAATTEGKFPVPKQHQMLEGESHEWPGDKS